MITVGYEKVKEKNRRLFDLLPKRQKIITRGRRQS